MIQENEDYFTVCYKGIIGYIHLTLRIISNISLIFLHLPYIFIQILTTIRQLSLQPSCLQRLLRSHNETRHLEAQNYQIVGDFGHSINDTDFSQILMLIGDFGHLNYTE